MSLHVYYSCPVYYLKATFGLGTGDAVLEIPLYVNDSGRCLSFSYQISSPRIQLVVLQSNSIHAEVSAVKKYADQNNIGGWNEVNFPLNSDVRSIQLVAETTGVTKNAEYLLVDAVKVDLCSTKGT